jgi:hypothetical protein
MYTPGTEKQFVCRLHKYSCRKRLEDEGDWRFVVQLRCAFDRWFQVVVLVRIVLGP